MADFLSVSLADPPPGRPKWLEDLMWYQSRQNRLLPVRVVSKEQPE